MYAYSYINMYSTCTCEYVYSLTDGVRSTLSLVGCVHFCQYNVGYVRPSALSLSLSLSPSPIHTHTHTHTHTQIHTRESRAWKGQAREAARHFKNKKIQHKARCTNPYVSHLQPMRDQHSSLAGKKRNDIAIWAHMSHGRAPWPGWTKTFLLSLCPRRKATRHPQHDPDCRTCLLTSQYSVRNTEYSLYSRITRLYIQCGVRSGGKDWSLSKRFRLDAGEGDS